GALSGAGTWTGPIQLVGNAQTTQVNIGSQTGAGAAGLSAAAGFNISGPNAVITSSGVTLLDKGDSGIPFLRTADTYQADTLVSAGTLRMNNSAALGPGFNTTVNPTSPAAGATLELVTNLDVTNQNALFLTGDGVTRDPAAGPIGALTTVGGGSTNATWE